MKIWIVNMGIGENVENGKAMRVFKSKSQSIKWVKEHFKEQIKEIERYDIPDNDYGITIGNSFHIYSMNVEAETQTTDSSKES